MFPKPSCYYDDLLWIQYLFTEIHAISGLRIISQLKYFRAIDHFYVIFLYKRNQIKSYVKYTLNIVINKS